ncbi:MAG TPA: SAM-dependent methyltransferase [Streptosporangiaceae bacterium]
MEDWVAWHRLYDEAGSPLRARLDRVTFHLRRALDQAPPGPVRLLSLCAGQGRDVLEVLPAHPRGRDVAATLVEADGENARLARWAVDDAGLSGVEVREADASVVANFADTLAVDVLLLAGIFGNISAADIEQTIDAAPALCVPGGTVIWTRHRRSPDATTSIRSCFAASGFEEVAFDRLDNEHLASVGVHRLTSRRAGRLPADDRPLFRFNSSHHR